MSGTSPKYKLNKEDAPAIAKAWAFGAGIAVLVFTGDFLSTEIDLGLWAPAIAMVIPTAIKTAQRWWTDFMKVPVDPAT